MEVVEITDFNKENTASKSVASNNLSSLQDGVYLLKVSQNQENKLIPYIKNTPTIVAENEIVTSENNNILSLKINPEELLAVNLFDENKNLVKTISKEEYTKDGGVNLATMDHQKYTFEIVTEFYNLQFNKSIGTSTGLENSTDIFTKNNQIIVKSRNNIKTISIYTISGALIQNIDINTSNFESKPLESGIYVTQVTLSNGQIINKKVKL